MTEDQATQLIAAVQQLHADNQALLTLSSAQLGYTMHLHELVSWLIFLSLIFGLCVVAMLRPRGA